MLICGINFTLLKLLATVITSVASIVALSSGSLPNLQHILRIVSQASPFTGAGHYETKLKKKKKKKNQGAWDEATTIVYLTAIGTSCTRCHALYITGALSTSAYYFYTCHTCRQLSQYPSHLWLPHWRACNFTRCGYHNLDL